MERRDFLHSSTAAAIGSALFPRYTLAGGENVGLRWSRDESSGLISGVAYNGQPLPVLNRSTGVFGAALRLIAGDGAGETHRIGLANASKEVGALSASLTHRLVNSGKGEDLLAAELEICNESDHALEIHAHLLVSLQPGEDLANHWIHVPLSAAGGSRDPRFSALGVEGFLEDCDQHVAANDFTGHYLEPMASFPGERKTHALMLAPVLEIFHRDHPCRVAVFMESDLPARFRFTREHAEGRVWEIGRMVTVPAGGKHVLRGWLHLHTGDAGSAWGLFHRFGHREEHPAVGWTRDFKIHYYDFLSSAAGKNGRRGGGYEADLAFFKEFRVGMATQHGYYPHLGDYIHPDRKTWLAMRGDTRGPAEMSLEKMRERIRATRASGAKAAIYLHPVLLDDAGPIFKELRDCVMLNEHAAPVAFPWEGPDTQGKNWRASLASASWRAHLLRQAAWIMELLDPDAIVVDETFAGIGYDFHPDRAGPMSAGAIDFFRKLRSLVRSFGHDRAVFSSDCSMAPFVLWLDGECGDHAYKPLLGRPSYTREPVRYLAALGDKPWRPCAWHFRGMWDEQMKFARQVGAGVGVSNGWMEYTGLAGLPAADRAALVADINELF